MDATALPSRSAGEVADLVQRREVSSEEVVRASLTRIAEVDQTLGAFITVCGDAAMATARRLDAEFARGRRGGPLSGVPFAVKDAFWTRGIRTTNGSRLFADFVPAQDATAVARLQAAGAILIGKLNMMELGFGPTLSPPFGVPRNPWDLARTPGGSSSGSASAVAAGLVPLTLGGDTGGSIRLPASFCGVVGLKPTWGRVSRHGLMPICARFDTAGPLAATAADCALALHAIAGCDRRDPTTSRRPVADYPAAAREDVTTLRIGVVKELTESPLVDREVRDLVEAALAVLAGAGVTVRPVSIPLSAFSSEIYVATAEPEAAARYRSHLVDRVRDIDVLPRRRLLAASLIPASLASRVAALGERLRAEVDAALRKVDVLAAPTTPTAATRISSEATPASPEEAWRLGVVGRSLLANPFNVTGHPALSAPCGFTSGNLPVGLQVIGRHFREEDVLRVAAAYQAATDWHRRRPPVQARRDRSLLGPPRIG